MIVNAEEKAIVGERIRKLRGELGITMAVMGAKAGVTRQSVHAWEMGKSLPDWFSLENMKNNLSINPSWVMLGQGEKFLDKRIMRLVELTRSANFSIDAAIDYVEYLSDRKQPQSVTQ